MASITVHEGRATLGDLIRRMTPGQEVEITENNGAIAKLVTTPLEEPRKIPKLGTQKGSELSIDLLMIRWRISRSISSEYPLSDGHVETTAKMELSERKISALKKN